MHSLGVRFQEGISNTRFLRSIVVHRERHQPVVMNSSLPLINMSFTKDPLNFWHKFILQDITHMSAMVS